jgi:hypothetical protein
LPPPLTKQIGPIGKYLPQAAANNLAFPKIFDFLSPAKKPAPRAFGTWFAEIKRLL